MKQNPPIRKLREHPDLNQLKCQAKELLKAFLASEADAVADVKTHYRGADPSDFALHDAQLVLARSYGFDSWPKLKAYVDGATARRLAEFICAGDETQVRAMLERRPELANIAMSYGDERGPLHYAVMERAPEIVRLLMRHGADARKGVHPHRDATTAITIASERGYDEIVAIIEQEEQRRRASMSASGAIVTSAQDELSDAIASGEGERAIAMLEADPSLVHCCDREGWTPLHVASAVRSIELVAWLLKQGAAPNQNGRDGRTPLDLAAASRGPLRMEEFIAIAGMLRQAGAELTARAAVALSEEVWL
ncbi:MAG: ankyrin repeat domain-containing protein, partial [Bryobacteraceae bacterium]